MGFKVLVHVLCDIYYIIIISPALCRVHEVYMSILYLY